jgi:hypothetical protein
MNQPKSAKLAALAVALVLNCTMIGGVALLFSAQLNQNSILALAGA